MPIHRNPAHLLSFILVCLIVAGLLGAAARPGRAQARDLAEVADGPGSSKNAHALVVNAMGAGSAGPRHDDAVAVYTLSTGDARTGTGWGYVTRYPAMDRYDGGTAVLLEANPYPGSQFVGWTGDLTGATNPATVTMDGDKAVYARFDRIPNVFHCSTAFGPSTPGWGGTSFASIQAAIDAAQDGDSILVAGDTFDQSVDLNKDVDLVLDSGIVIGGSLTQSAGTLQAPGGPMLVGGNWTRTGGTFNANGGTVAFVGMATQCIGGSQPTAFSNLAITAFRAVALGPGADVTVAHLEINAGTLDGSAGTLRVSGDWMVGSAFMAGSGKVVFNGTVAQAIAGPGPTTFNDLEIANTGPYPVVSTAAVTVNGALTISAGTFVPPIGSQLHDVTIGTNGRLAEPAGTLNVSGDWIDNSAILTTGSTVVFNGSAAQSIGGSYATMFDNLTIANTGTQPVTARAIWGRNLAVNDGTFAPADGSSFNNVTIGAEGTLAGPAGTVNVTGNWTNNGAFTAGSGTVTFKGSGAQDIGGANCSTFYNLTIANTGTDPVSNTRALTVTRLLDISDGSFIPACGSHFRDITIGAQGSLQVPTDCGVTVDGAMTNNGATNLRALGITTSGDGRGTVSTDPAGNAFAQNTSVKLTASPAGRSLFTRWGGTLSGTVPTATLALTATQTVDARFDLYRTDLAVTMTPITRTLPAGVTAVFTLTVTNNGPQPAAGVVVTDTLPAGIGYQSATPSQGSVSVAGQQVVASLGELASGASATVTLHVLPAVDARGNLTHTAVVTGVDVDEITANSTASQTVTVRSPAGLQLAVSAGRTTVPAAWDYAYTIVVTNTGPSVAWDVNVTDTLPASVFLVSVPAGAVLHADGSLTWHLDSLAVNGVATFVLPVRTFSNLRGALVNPVGASCTDNAPVAASNTITVIDPPVSAAPTPPATATPAARSTPEETATPTPAATPTATAMPGATATSTPTPTATPATIATPTATATSTDVPAGVTIHGTVYGLNLAGAGRARQSANGTPLVGARLVLGTCGPGSYETVTDEQGRYELWAPEASLSGCSEVTLTVSAAGYETVAKSFSVERLRDSTPVDLYVPAQSWEVHLPFVFR